VLGRNQWWPLAKCSVTSWIDDAAPSMGASLAFYTLFSLAPLLLVMVALAGPFVGPDEAQGLLLEQIARLTGENAAAGIKALLDAAAAHKAIASTRNLTLVMLVLGATTVFVELQADLNRIWRYKPEKGKGVARFLRTRLLSFTLVITVGLLLFASVAATAWLAWMGKRWFPHSGKLVGAAEFGVSFVIVTGLFAMIYKLLPRVHVEWRDVWVGAAVTSVLFWVGKVVIGFYITKAAIGSDFGTAGAIVVVIAWVYYNAQVFFLGAEFTRQYALRHGSQQEGRDELRAADENRRGPGDVFVANEAALIQRAAQIARGADPVLQRAGKSSAGP
jgi:membrane protein